MALPRTGVLHPSARLGGTQVSYCLKRRCDGDPTEGSLAEALGLKSEAEGTGGRAQRQAGRRNLDQGERHLNWLYRPNRAEAADYGAAGYTAPPASAVSQE
ncbi:hypothetical protein NDU88_000995 [Pleurodeles waltl]|uniref:Uncharacterized protein n=1 Tax=Pleurodeles waltl TaxID=8319 RepID=A0AAV7WKH8_PLEWA|nr:hypothetical protein NDU88_000995 [Pleurodeles waltl]